jgi:signal transduction histidine kinase/ketosteroid isomerase-like protein
MKLTQKLEAEILKTYNTYWDNYLKGDVEAMHPLLADEYTQVGSAEGEVFSNKKDAVQFLYDTIDQVAKKLEMRHRKTTIEKQENSVLVHEFCDLYALANNKWVFYSKFRASSLMQQKKEGWKIIHQHSSFPDTKTEEGQNIAIDKIAEENLQLREAVRRRTIELETKNRELEIETALEKVRTVAMAMKKADDMLSVCKTISQQLAKLGVKEIRNVQTAIFYVDRGTYMNYEYYAKHTKTFITEVGYKSHKIQLAFAKKMMKGPNEEVLEHLKGKKLQDWYTYQKSTNQFADNYLLKAHSLNYYWYSIGPVALGTSTYYPLTKDETDLFKRFLKVFELAYRRYLDIEKATAQAREAQIEVALERVRAASMAMRNSSALSEIINKVYVELTKLDAQLDRCFIMIVNPENKGITWWMAGQEGLLAENGFFVPMNEHPSHLMYLKYCKQRKKKWTYLFQGKEKRDWDRFGFSKTELAKLPEPVKKFMAAAKQVHLSGSSNEFGSLVTGSFEPLPEEQQDIISRFTIAFNQAYIRFLDLQKAEAQAREAEIELALERVRARTMSMHKSDELSEVVALLHKQFEELDFGLYQILISIINTEKQHVEWWSRGFGYTEQPQRYLIPFTNHPFPEIQKQNWKSGKTYHAYILEGDLKKSWEKYLFTRTELKHFPEEVKKQMRSVKGVYLSDAYMKYGVLQAAGPEPLSQDKAEILIRFAKVLDQAYTRMIDLQKAEAQAREAQIETALERVRSRTMGMQQSNELPEAANLLFQQVQSLGMPAWSAGYCIWDDDLPAGQAGKQGITLWMSSEGVMQPSFHAPLTKDPSFIHMREAYEKGQTFHVEEVGGKALVKHYNYMRTLPVVGDVLDSIIEAGHPLPVFQIFHCVYFSQGFLLFITYKPVPEAHEIFKRFGKVFDQTYTRFLDLQKAEAQAREAQIEVAVERVRAKALAMHKSDEILGVVITLRNELEALKIPGVVATTIYLQQENGDVKLWDITSMKEQQEGIHFSMNFNFRMEETDSDLWIRKIWDSAENYVVIEQDEQDLRRAIEWTRKYNIDTAEMTQQFLEANQIVRSWHPTVKLSNGKLATDFILPPEAEVEFILLKMGAAFDLAYKRFLDLQNAEAQTREAKIETALEKIRSRTMAMQSSNELQETATVLFNEFKKLGTDNIYQVTIGIYNEEEGLIDFRVTSWAGSGEQESRSFNLSMNEPTVLQPSVAAWKAHKKSLVIDLTGKALEGWLSYRNKMSGITVRSEDTAGRRVISVAYFSKGHLSISTPVPPPQETIKTLERFAAVFDGTYTRFLDLEKAEAQALKAEQDLIAIKEAKQKAEEALTELQATQKQLIQSEKMASLGELTAGIAHEIQNPLNFVNNFSEVSSELISEMVQEVDKGNYEEVKAIADDVKQNLEKINHHGNRAADIVKGMLQHSRSSSSVKEPTNINALADEYLRLAYHGLRAKDKSFNATMKTDFDETIGNINVIPQDIGRVILNLITNAFYAAPLPPEGGFKDPDYLHNPTVWVSTKKDGNKILISVKDNGPGIPQKILDKIFQPFFTTKPTGQGTGLGLSLSYDIVKAHGGELKVETKEGEGSEFFISLPV